MAIEDAVCLAELIEQSGGDFAGAFRRYERARYCAPRACSSKSRYHWDNFYHVEGIEREVVRCDSVPAAARGTCRMPGLAL